MRPQLVAVVLALCVLGAACSSSAQKRVDEVTARAAAEVMRGALKTEHLKSTETARSMTALRRAADRIPGSPTISGLVDANHDGKDDDGNVAVTVGGQSACLTAHDNGTVDVSNGRC